ncbi:ABC transporter ATP-binding protein [Pseudooceanicola sediminis]|uniref:ABC transporter ATP-binding protein n=1 Tax=Pseudooceanicola sediminis TaxID=2211117 RepID=A0A399J3V7_9RHOB|nr:ABC transporter ATP-binding protein [Pseudooceanicola sediminis]KAA2313823.1 ABC transporter ATP-binding protein [Puniceibacterium sp. HSS470]RII38642.1 ABC transporter ATP-binding protein [Pseudooceanicola sediminis]|tara:strand:+ start:15533 stop:17293 length:1761 start_codon:yes stop_codon:yes gene_type:complete
MSSASIAPLLSIRDLHIEFDTPHGPVSAVRGINLDLAPAQTVAVVGESGSGKSTMAAAVNGLLAGNGRVTSGQILFEGRDLVQASEAELRRIRGSGIGLVPQDPMSNLNPIQRVGTQIAEVLKVHGQASGRAAHARAVDLLDMVGINDPARRARQYPHELSGGMRQRVLIAIGLACRPRLLIADEPTSALDVTVQKVILDELQSLTAEMGTAVILITHDLPLASERCDEALVMFRGDMIERGPAARVMQAPQSEYTRRLIDAAPTLDAPRLVRSPTTASPGTPGSQRVLAELVQARKEYPGAARLFGRAAPFVAVEGMNLKIPRGQTVAVVGESGSGKSTTAKMLLRTEQVTTGDIIFDGLAVTRLRRKRLHDFRRRVQPVFQNPYGSLDARWTVGASIEEPLCIHRIGTPATRQRKVEEALDAVALPRDLASRLPAELSGGQRQRVAIARALVLDPDLVVLDEAVSALDVIVQAQILKLLADLQEKLGLSYLFISHDLAVVRQIAHHVYVMQHGRIVEHGETEALFAAPQQEYTRQLLAAIPGVTPLVRAGAQKAPSLRPPQTETPATTDVPADPRHRSATARTA